MGKDERISKYFSKRTEKIVDNMSLMDDDLMSMVFENNIPATELLLKTILGEGVTVIESRGQVELNNPLVKGRNIKLDIFARDINGRIFNCEVQRDESRADPRRARFHSSMIDVRALKSSEEFKTIRDTYVIFITESDYFKAGEPLYFVRRNVRIKKSIKPFNDGNVIIYVNGSYKGDDPIGHLMSDFRNRRTEGFYNSELEKAVCHFKQEEGGRRIMCEAVEEYAAERAAKSRVEGREEGRIEGRIEGREEGKAEALLESVRNIMKNLTISAEQAMKALGIPESEYSKYLSML